MVLKIGTATTLCYGTFASISKFVYEFVPTCRRCTGCSVLSAGTLFCRTFQEEVVDDNVAGECREYQPQ